jgi:hypothetical protein
MTREEADRMVESKGWVVKEDAGRGYRRVVASPKPMEIVEMETRLRTRESGLDKDTLLEAKKMGFSDKQIASLTGKKEEEISSLRISLGILPDFTLVDTCAAEFQAFTPYYYSTYDKQP